ncbi:hypothetical protein ACSQ67_014764 [Phaseolus vulgaris]
MTFVNEHVADNHFRMPRVGDRDGDVNNDQNNLFFLTPITSFFTDHLFFFVTWICNGNLLFVPPFATGSLKSLLERCSHSLLDKFTS